MTEFETINTIITALSVVICIIAIAIFLLWVFDGLGGFVDDD